MDDYLNVVPRWKLLEHLLREACPFIRDAGDDEDPEAKQRACELLEQIEAALSATERET